MNSKHENGSWRRTRMMTLVLAAFFLSSPLLRSQNGIISTTVSFSTGDITSDLLFASVQGNLHLVIEARAGENGCTQYSIRHNGHNVSGLYNVMPWVFTFRPGILELSICGDDCLVHGWLYGSVMMHPSNGEAVPGVEYFASYEIEFFWDRCTNQWRFGFLILRDLTANR